ncbi:MAG: hypothetical protein J1F03_00125 [Oscillospiraceae bacterium]|nr:hypothetical protein [Oscillospiraceae bacterium]
MDDKNLTEIGEQIVKQKRPKRSEQLQVHTEPGDNRKYIQHSLRLASLPKCDLKSTESVTQRITEYFEICAEDDMKPSVAGLALAMDIDRRYLWEIREGHKGKNPEVADAIKKAMKILDLQMVDYMQNGKINPVSGIFLMKNNFGYADKQEVVVTPNSPLGDAKDTKELEEQYIESVVDED